VEKPLWEQQSFPERLFRFIVLVCIVGWGISIIYVASHIGPLEEPPTRTRDLASFFFTSALIFIFFYVQYRIVPRFIHRDLDRRVGSWHAAGGLTLLIIGALNAASLQGRTDVPSTFLFWMTLLGEAVFIGNVIWSYVRDEPAVPFLAVVPTAAFGAGGIVSLILNVPAYPIPVPVRGRVHFLPFAYLWLAAAAPFAIFAMLYRFLMDAQRLVFEESLNRIHFVVTIIAILDLVRVFTSLRTSGLGSHGRGPYATCNSGDAARSTKTRLCASLQEV
jgi:hypothetical protein